MSFSASLVCFCICFLFYFYFYYYLFFKLLLLLLFFSDYGLSFWVVILCAISHILNECYNWYYFSLCFRTCSCLCWHHYFGVSRSVVFDLKRICIRLFFIRCSSLSDRRQKQNFKNYATTSKLRNLKFTILDMNNQYCIIRIVDDSKTKPCM